MFKKGFTLIELIIVVVILAIIAMIAFPHFMNATTRSGAIPFGEYIAQMRPDADMSTLNYQCHAINVMEYQCNGSVVVPALTDPNGQVLSLTRIDVNGFCTTSQCSGVPRF